MTSTSRARKTSNGRYHSRSQCVWGTTKAVMAECEESGTPSSIPWGAASAG